MRLVREKAGKHERQEEIRRLLRARRISTQQELAELLAAQGIEATQATLSRDLAELGVLRVSRPEGAVYEMEPVSATATPQLAELGETILSLRENDFLVVLRTRRQDEAPPLHAPMVSGQHRKVNRAVRGSHTRWLPRARVRVVAAGPGPPRRERSSPSGRSPARARSACSPVGPSQAGRWRLASAT